MEGVTDGDKPRRLGPKRANYIRKVFALRKTDDVRKYVVRREIKKGDKTFYKSPKIQRLVTEKRLRRKRLEKKEKAEGYKASKDAKAKYDKVLSKYIKERKAHDHKKEGHEEAPKKEVKAAPVQAKKEQAKPVEVKKAAAPAKQAAAPQKAAAPTKQAAKKKWGDWFLSLFLPLLISTKIHPTHFVCLYNNSLFSLHHGYV